MKFISIIHLFILTTSIILLFQGVSPEKTGTSNQRNQKWTVGEMEKYMRDQGETSIHLGMVGPPEDDTTNKRRTSLVQLHI